MFFKILKYDLKNTIIKKYKNYLLSFFVFCWFLLEAYTKIFYSEITLKDVTVTEIVLFIFNGMREYIPDGFTSFRFPTMWMVIFVLLLFFTLYYPYNDIMGYGKNVLIASTSRTAWWLSKCVTTICICIVYFFTAALSILIFSFSFGLKFELKVTQESFSWLIRQGVPEGFNSSPEPLDLILTVFVLPFIFAIAMCLFQMMLTLIIRPFASIIVVTSIFMVSAYFLNPFMIGNYGMTQRSICFVSNGVDPVIGTVIMSLIIVFSIAAGTVLFNRYEILEKEQ